MAEPKSAKATATGDKAEAPKPNSRSRLGVKGVLFAVAAVGGATALLLSGAGKVEEDKDCGCPREWKPLCMDIEVPEDERNLPQWMNHRVGDYTATLKKAKQVAGHTGYGVTDLLRKPMGVPVASHLAYLWDIKQEIPMPEDRELRFYSTAPNKCEADCMGVQAGLVEGVCPGVPASAECLYMKGCVTQFHSGNIDPVCWQGQTFVTPCYAECVVTHDWKQPFDADKLQKGECPDLCHDQCLGEVAIRCQPHKGPCLPSTTASSPPSSSSEAECLPFRCAETGSCGYGCDETWEPVCWQGVTYTNRCWAECDGVEKAEDGVCTHVHPAFPQALPFPAK